MKKIFIVILGFAPIFGSAQDIKSKKGENYLPEAKDWALQIDAVPFLNYTGRLLSSAGSTSPNIASNSLTPLTIGGKYFLTNSYAYRAKVRIGLTSNTLKNTIIDNAKTNTDTIFTSDSKTFKSTNITLSFGFEKRRGKTRLQGYYGAEAILNIATQSTKYSYGNPFTSNNPSVYSTDFTTATSSGFSNKLESSRELENKNGTTIGLGARGFVGVEYFIFPKISIAAELGWGLAFSTTNDGYVAKERWDNSANSKDIKTNPKAGNNSFGVDTDNNGGNLMLSFHF
jgi:hypothetical protein